MLTFGAERTLAAEKGPQRIAVEVKSFLGPSEVHDLEGALGQFVFYRHLIKQADAGRELLLAMPEEAFDSLLSDEAGMDLARDLSLKLFTVDPIREEIVRWLR